MSYNAKNYTEQGGERTVIGGILEIKEGAQVIGLPEGQTYTLPVASSDSLGGVKAAAKGNGDTVPVKVDAEGNLYVPTYPTQQTYTLPAASANALGGVKAATKGTGDTVPVKVDAEGNLYVPTYPTVPAVPKAANQAASTAADVAALLADFNALLTKLKAAGLMTAD